MCACVCAYARVLVWCHERCKACRHHPTSFIPPPPKHRNGIIRKPTQKRKQARHTSSGFPQVVTSASNRHEVRPPPSSPFPCLHASSLLPYPAPNVYIQAIPPKTRGEEQAKDKRTPGRPAKAEANKNRVRGKKTRQDKTRQKETHKTRHRQRDRHTVCQRRKIQTSTNKPTGRQVPSRLSSRLF